MKYWSLVETVRTADGPRQRTLCYLGELNGSAHARWQKTVEVFNEPGESTQLKLFLSEVEAPDDPNIARVLVPGGTHATGSATAIWGWSYGSGWGSTSFLRSISVTMWLGHGSRRC
jgi:hypothetical protein